MQVGLVLKPGPQEPWTPYIDPIPTIKLDGLQPHEGNIVDFLFRTRAFQTTPERMKA